MQHKKVLEKVLPESLKIAIAQKIENHLFSKVLLSRAILYVNFFASTNCFLLDRQST